MISYVGMDATPAGIEDGERRGVFQYIYQIARHLCIVEPALHLRLLFGLPRRRHAAAIRTFAESLGSRNVTVRRSAVPKSWLLRMGIPADMMLGRLDVFHAPAHIALRCRSCPLVVTVHDLAFLRDLADGGIATHLTRSDQKQWDVRRRFFAELAAHIHRSVREAQIVIAVSRATADDLVASLAVPVEKIRVVYHGLRHQLGRSTDAVAAGARARYAGSAEYWLYLGALDPNKNLITMIDAYARYRAFGGAARLVIAGRKEFFATILSARIERLGLAACVSFTDHVADEDLAPLYAGAVGLLMPSPLEGFGMPAVEAMACGTPVVAANAGALPEIVGDAGVLVDPLDPDAFAGAMRELEENASLRMRITALGERRAGEFCWKRAAAQTLNAYAEAAAQ